MLNVSGLLPPPSMPDSPALYTVQSEALTNIKSTLDEVKLNNIKMDELIAISGKVVTKSSSKAIVPAVLPIQASLQTLAHGTNVSLADLESYAMFPPSAHGPLIDEPYLKQVLIGQDQLVIQNMAINTKLNDVITIMQASGTDAIVDRLDSVISLLNAILSRIMNIYLYLNEHLDINLSDMQSVVTDTNVLLHDKCDTKLSTIGNHLTTLENQLDTALYTYLPVLDTDTDMLVKKTKLPLSNLLLRALFLPQRVYETTNRTDYTFVPYLSSTALVSGGTGTNQFAPQVNKNDPYGPGDLAINVLEPENVLARLIDPDVIKSITTIDWHGAPEFLMKRK